MCGISGVLVSPSDLARVPVDEVIATLMREMEPRGKEATGIARVTSSNRVRLTKHPVTASTFLAHHPGIGAGCRLMIAHSRLSTQGDPKDNVNNHPIVVGDIYGVHNGSVSNDYELYRKHGWTRHGKVDSEVIFAAISHLGVKAGLEAVEGAIAAAWYDKADPGALWMARHTSSPLNVGITEGGSVIFASTAVAVNKAAVLFPGKLVEDVISVKEGVIMRFAHDEQGALQHEVSCFTPPVRSYGWTQREGTWSPAGTGFRRETVVTPITTKASQAGTTSKPSASAPDWAIGGGGYVLKKGDAVVFVPQDGGFCDLIGKYMGATFKSGTSYVEVWLDLTVSDELTLPTNRLWPLSVWRDKPDKIPTKGMYALEAAQEGKGGLVYDVDDEDDDLDEAVQALAHDDLLEELMDDASDKADLFWNAIVTAEADHDDTLADALAMAWRTGVDIDAFVDSTGAVTEPSGLLRVVNEIEWSPPQAEHLALPAGCEWDDTDAIIDVSSVEVD